jgi:cell division protein ZapE
MLIKEAYQQQIKNKQLVVDNAQLQAVDYLQILTANLEIHQQYQGLSFFQRLLQPKPNKIKGIYFYGQVGRGKTMLMDLFFQHLPIKKKQRIHFHRFMESIHQQLNAYSRKNRLTRSYSTDDPLTYIAKTWSKKIDVLCFDEFFVSDIADAMLISGLLQALFKHGVVLVATSNCQPENLYRNGLQRERFLPTIALLNKHCDVISINGDMDHRLTALEAINDTLINKALPYRDYAFPMADFPEFLQGYFTQLTQQKNLIFDHNIILYNRAITYIARGGINSDVIWFDFFELCSGPRSQRDYMAIADEFSVVLISNVPQFSGKLIPAVFSGVEDRYQRSGVLLGDLRYLDDEARRFIALVDEFYERDIRLILSAEVDILALYQGQQLSFEFDRCQSRLFEMQSLHYKNK